jgi:hypothetical protein
MTKELFLKDKKLAAQWRSIVNDGLLDLVLLYARGEIVERAPSQEELRGAELMAHTLHELAEVEPTEFEFPNPGLHHDLDRMPGNGHTKQTKAKKK